MSKSEKFIRGSGKALNETIKALRRLGCSVKMQVVDEQYGTCVGIIAQCCPGKERYKSQQLGGCGGYTPTTFSEGSTRYMHGGCGCGAGTIPLRGGGQACPKALAAQKLLGNYGIFGSNNAQYGGSSNSNYGIYGSDNAQYGGRARKQMGGVLQKGGKRRMHGKQRGGAVMDGQNPNPNNLLLLVTKPGAPYQGIPTMPSQSMPPMSREQIEAQCQMQGLIFDPASGACVAAMTDEGMIPMQPQAPQPGDQLIPMTSVGAIQQNIANLQQMVASKQASSMQKANFYQVVQEKLNEIIASLQQLGSRNAELEATTAQLNQIIAALQAEKSQLGNSLAQCSADRDAIAQQLAELKQQLVASTQRLAQNEQLIQQLQTEKAEAVAALQQTQAQLQELAGERANIVNQMETQRQELSQLAAEKQQISQEAQAEIMKIRQEYEPQIAAAKQEVASAQGDRAQYASAMTQLQQTAEAKNQEIAEVKAAYEAQMIKIKEEADAVQANMQALAQENAALKAEIGQLQAEKASAAQDLEAIRGQLATCAARMQKLIDLGNQSFAQFQSIIQN